MATLLRMITGLTKWLSRTVVEVTFPAKTKQNTQKASLSNVYPLENNTNIPTKQYQTFLHRLQTLKRRRQIHHAAELQLPNVETPNLARLVMKRNTTM